MNSAAWQADFARSPLFAGLQGLCTGFVGDSDWPDADRLNALAATRGTCTAQGRHIRFVAQEGRIGQREYELRILASGEVPTRPRNWHDLFNALVWLAFPATKARLNAVQCSALGGTTAGRRGPLADAATLFDESGLVLVARNHRLADLLRARRWHDAFWECRSEWRQTRVLVVGHSLLEKALQPRPGITGKALLLVSEVLPREDADAPAWLDQAIAARWAAGAITCPADLFPLPLFGIPGYADNADSAFYADTAVFRVPRPPG